MGNRIRSGLLVCAIFFFMDPLSASTSPDRGQMPWPALLSAEWAPSDPSITALQHRANASLERLLRSAQSAG
jgi:hypothetical protein